MAGWHFVSIPSETTAEIDDLFSMAKKGWGSLPVRATIGNTTWKTSIFPDKKTSSYLLPLKAEVRKNEQIREGDTITIVLKLEH